MVLCEVKPRTDCKLRHSQPNVIRNLDESRCRNMTEGKTELKWIEKTDGKE